MIIENQEKIWLVNWQTMLLFQPEAPGDDDNVMAGAVGEFSNVEETAEGQTHAGSPQDNAEADVDTERAEV
jgi:hypothetical protein